MAERATITSGTLLSGVVGPADLTELSQYAAAPPEMLANWFADGLIMPGRAVTSTDKADKALIALLGELHRRRFCALELKEVASIINQSCDAARRTELGRGALREAAFHATLIAADEAGQFDQVANAPGVPADLALFESYAQYRRWLTSCGRDPSAAVDKAAREAGPDFTENVSYYLELHDPAYLTGTSLSPFWDFAQLYGGVRIISRGDAPAVPWDMADGSDLASFVTVSMPVLARDISRRRANN